MPDDDNTQDLTPYDLAQRLVDGLPVTDAGKREIAVELLALRAKAERDCPELLHTASCSDCGWSGTDKDFHACPGRPGENEF